MMFQTIKWPVNGTTTQHVLHCLCLVSATAILYLTAHVRLLQP